MNNRTEARKQLATSACGGSSYTLKSINSASATCLPRPGDGGSSAVKSPAEDTPAYIRHPHQPCDEEKTPCPQTLVFHHEFTPPTATAQTRRHDRSGRTYLPAAARNAAATLRAVFERYTPPTPFKGPVKVTLSWTWPGADTPKPKSTRPDLDNLAKLALDAATKAGYWTDDAQVVHLDTAKFTGPMPGIAVRVECVQRGVNA